MPARFPEEATYAPDDRLAFCCGVCRDGRNARPRRRLFAGRAAAPDAVASSDDAFRKWLDDVRRLPAGEQLKAVSKKLEELNPGFDGHLSFEQLQSELSELRRARRTK